MNTNEKAELIIRETKEYVKKEIDKIGDTRSLLQQVIARKKTLTNLQLNSAIESMSKNIIVQKDDLKLFRSNIGINYNPKNMKRIKAKEYYIDQLERSIVYLEKEIDRRN